MFRRLSLIVLAMLSLAGIHGGVPVAAARGCFPETQQCLDGLFHSYWETYGGLPVFGFPITAEAPEISRDDPNQVRRSQWLERSRFENFNDTYPAPYNVLLGRLGDDRLRQLGIDWQTLPKAQPTTAHYFAATGHAIAHEPFWRYWSAHGLEFDGRPGKAENESLALFGYPISEPRIETNTSGDTVLTQWFERARFEDHGPKGVLLGLLSNEVRAGAPATPAPPQIPGQPSAGAPGEKTVRQILFYDKPLDGTTIEQVVQRAEAVIFGRGVSYYRDLRNAGYTGLALEYLIANEVNGPWATPGSSCDASHVPYRNTVAYNQGDFCTYIHPNESWFLHNGQGQRLYGKRSDGHYVYHMNPASPGWQQFAASRISRDLVGDGTQAKIGYNGIFLDNVALRLYKLQRQITSSDGTVREFSSDSAYRSAVIGHVGVIRSTINGAGPLWANVIDDRGVSAAEYMPLVEQLDGYMNESWAMTYPSESSHLSADAWNNVLMIAEQTLSKGKSVFSVVQGSKDDAARQQFGLASHLLISNTSTSYFRYAHASKYHEWWQYDNYNVMLGAPKGRRYQVASTWRRDFECGYVLVDPGARTGKIVQTCN